MHGGPGSGAYWLEYFSGDILENKFRMIYVDQRGVSRSESPANQDFSIDRMIKDFEEIREALGIEKWLTLGHSFGGILQMAYAEAYPDPLLGMIMINCTVDLNSAVNNIMDFGIKELNITDTADYYDTAANKIEKASTLIGQMIDKGVFWKVHYSEEENFHKMAEVMSSIKGWNYDFSRRALGIADYFKDYGPVTEEINVPVLFFYGKNDHAIGEQHYKEYDFQI
jgi:proline iminopeptidase